MLVCSINNIGDEQAPEDIIEEMKEVKELVEDHSKLYRQDPPSTVSIATCIQPPQVLLLPPATQGHRPGGLDPTHHLPQQSRANQLPEQDDQVGH